MRLRVPPGLLAAGVSIRARPIGRAMPVGGRSHRVLPVSIRARPIGRAMPASNAQLRGSARVSIRARPIGRAMPDRLVGRVNARDATDLDRCFNPRPADWPGDASYYLDCDRQEFQSAPGRLAGRCADVGSWLRSVSIRARPIGRAMPQVATPLAAFQSAPGRLAGRCDQRPHAALHEFQSAPGRLAGRCVRSRLSSLDCRCFNPRPADWPGDAPLAQVVDCAAWRVELARKGGGWQGTASAEAWAIINPLAESMGCGEREPAGFRAVALGSRIRRRGGP